MPSLPWMLAHRAAPLQALRTLIELSAGDADKLQLLGEAQGLLSAAPAGAYPVQASPSMYRACACCAWLEGTTAACTAQSPSPGYCPRPPPWPPCPALQELRWLVTTAWNRGAVHARFGRAAEAERYQRWAAGALQYHAPLEEQYQVPCSVLRRASGVSAVQ